MTIAHDPTTEAAEKLGAGLSPRILEPGRPAVTEEPFFADDPAAVGDASQGDVVVTPTSAGDRTWDDLIGERPELAEWAAQRWLGNRPNLPGVPEQFPAARDGFHRLAYGVVAEARRLATTKFGLRYTRGGFGTPFFKADEQVRVEGNRLVHQRGDAADTVEITSLRAAADFLGLEPGTEAGEHDSPPLGDLDEDLGTTAEAGEFLGQWYGLAWSVLEELRLTPGAVDPERTQLWPGHFDPAIAMGDADAGTRATYGASPGDANHPEPYLYIGPWGEIDATDPFWNADGFPGAELSFAEMTKGDDHVAAALSFFRAGYDRLDTTSGV
ncbi:MAG: hypothetical protein DHS20C19_04940 [Acidimicrobiales bacterium]|nr:MAG: hypothetical protein DHS20C19_04940 [Acidimicrobiales bacterium]